MPLGTLNISTVTLEDDLDDRFKPGIHRQTAAFLEEDDLVACLLADHKENMVDYELMAGYR